ncbi:MAG TPA: VOC family protein [Candidatus Saccharimonadales bacterium]|nr:VOC family protein [Candidatus Saccharimonadales bacterium]
MFKTAFNGFSVNNAAEARKFYSEILGFKVTAYGYGTDIELPGGARLFFYPKGAGHKPAAYTMLNLVVDDIDKAVDELKAKGIKFEQYAHTDEKGIQRGLASSKGPDQAWFKDPAGNIISVLVEAS